MVRLGACAAQPLKPGSLSARAYMTARPGPQVVEPSLGLQQLGVRAAFDDAARIEHDDLVDLVQAVEPVGDEQRVTGRRWRPTGRRSARRRWAGRGWR